MRTRNNNGQALVEFALVAPLFFILIFAIMDIGVMFFVNLTMQQAVRLGTRYAITGRSDLGRDRRSALIQMVRNKSYGLYDKNVHNPKDPEISVVNPGKVSFTDYLGTATTGNPGSPNEIIVVSLTYAWPLITPVLTPFFQGGVYTFTVKSTMRNEFFTNP